MGMDLNPGPPRSLAPHRPCPRYQRSNKARQIDGGEKLKVDDMILLPLPRRVKAQNILTLAFFVSTICLRSLDASCVSSQENRRRRQVREVRRRSRHRIRTCWWRTWRADGTRALEVGVFVTVGVFPDNTPRCGCPTKSSAFCSPYTIPLQFARCIRVCRRVPLRTQAIKRYNVQCLPRWNPASDSEAGWTRYLVGRRRRL
jgi:hypothetical protein